MASTSLDTIKELVDALSEDDMCALIEHISKRVWIPTYVPRERFDLPRDVYTTLINDDALNAKINDFACYILQNKFDDENSSIDNSSDNVLETVAEVELETDEAMTVEGLIERMCTITDVTNS
jgi:hypothetical protein